MSDSKRIPVVPAAAQHPPMDGVLTYEYLNRFYDRALYELHWYQNALTHERNVSHQRNAMLEISEQMRAAVQASLTRSITTAQVESQRGNTYKRLYDESQDLASRLGQEVVHREQLEKRIAQLQRQLMQQEPGTDQVEDGSLEKDEVDGTSSK